MAQAVAPFYLEVCPYSNSIGDSSTMVAYTLVLARVDAVS
jgi:hypothetical protein